jgi:hypothetical protein
MPLTEEQRRERKRRLYQDHLDYINKYREGDTFYHVTRSENAESLIANGFDPSMIGKGGGCQGGPGFSVTWTAMDAWQWADKIYGWGREGLAVVKISLPGIKLATHQESDDTAQDALQWGKVEGYCDPNEEDFRSTEKLKALCPGEFASTGWALTGLYLQSIGFDGYMAGIDEVVVVNFAILKADAFNVEE